MAKALIISPTERTFNRSQQVPSGESSGQRKKDKTPHEKFEQAKKGFTCVGAGVASLSTLGLLISLFQKSNIPSKILQASGDFFGSIAALLSPFAIIGNEVKNYNLIKARTREEKNGFVDFHNWRKGFYRTCSLGFTPFVFEPFVNPEKFGKSVFHKIATIANIPNLLFTSFTWGVGNFQALLAWLLGKKEQIQAGNQKTTEEAVLRDKEYKEIFNGCERSAIIGSIANPTLQGLRQFADSLAFLTGQMEARDFFQRPSLGISRLVSLFVGLPETFAKGIDSVVRAVKERKHIQPALPKVLSEKLEKFANWYEPKVNTKEKTCLKSVRNYAEMIFHTLSPLSMFALFAPLLDEPHLDEEAQSRGGLQGLLDKVIGRTGKTLTLIFTGLYLTLARLPQTIFESIYFGRKLTGKLNKKEAGEKELASLKERLSNSFIVKHLSNFSESIIKKLVPDYYSANVHGYKTYEQIQAKYALDQAKADENLKPVFEIIKTRKEITDEQKVQIINYCLNYAHNEALQGNHTLTEDEKEGINKEVIRRIDEETKPQQNRKPLPFIGADFLATNIFQLFDLRTRLKAIEWGKSSHRNMTTAYENFEVHTFHFELFPVVAKCFGGLRNTINRLFGLARIAGMAS